MPSPDPSRLALVAALAAFATLNALMWVAGLRLADHVLALGLPTSVTAAVAVFTGLVVVLIGAGHLRRPVPTRA